MKKSLLFAVVICLGLALTAQNIPTVNKYQLNKMVKVDYRSPDNAINPFMNYEVSLVSNKGMVSPVETELGETFYDLQSNASINNRFQVWDDGTMAAVWTRGMQASAFPERGTAYNFFDGTSWGPWPTERIQDRRCGWPSIAAWGVDGEISVAHNGQEGLEWNQRETKGTGDWVQTNFLGPAGIEDDITWPRMITSGENNEYIHLFVNSYVQYEGQERTLLYSRSDDGGQTWDPHHVILEGMGDDYYFDLDADRYTMAATGNSVAILYGSAWEDMFMMKSTDNGDTWEKTVIWEHPYPFFDWNTTVTDTFFTVCNAANITLAPDGKAHVVFGINRVGHFDVGTTYNYWPYVDGIGYWNEDMETFSSNLNALAPPQYGYADSEMIENVNYIGWMQDVNGNGELDLTDDIMVYQQFGPSTLPTIGVTESDDIFVIYTSTTETYATDTYNYKHLWLRYNKLDQWGEFIDLTADIVHIFDECYYPVIGNVSFSSVEYIYNVDISPGLAWSDDHSWQQNRILYGKYDLPVGINELTDVRDMAIKLNPNPAVNDVTVSLSLDRSSDVTITISNITGQLVKEEFRSQLNSGAAKIRIDVSDLPAGTYVCSVKTKDAIGIAKLIVR